LYGTIFAATAAHARVFADSIRLLGVYDRGDYERRKFWRSVFVVVLCIVPTSAYLFFRSPVQMVVAGGIAQAVMLPLIGLAIIYLRRHVPRDIRPSPLTTTGLFVSASVMVVVVLGYLWLTFAS
jgi:manganese transport protein